MNRPNTRRSGGKYAVLNELCFAEFSRHIICHQIQNASKAIINQKNLTMHYVRICPTLVMFILEISNYFLKKNLSAAKCHMYWNSMSQIRKLAQKNMYTICFLCAIQLETRKNLKVAILLQIEVNLKNLMYLMW